MSDLAVVPKEPTEAMVLAAEMKMPQLGRLQIRFLYKTMVEAAPFPEKILQEGEREPH